MTTIGVALAWLAVRVTVVATLALGLVAWSGRRGARSGVVVLAGSMVLLLMLSLTAFVPLPDAWGWTVHETARLPTRPHSKNDAADSVVSQPNPDSEGMSILAKVLDWLRRSEGKQENATRTEQWGWGLAATVYLLGIGAGGVRLLVGWRQLRCLQRRSHTITDSDLVALADELAVKLCCRQHVEVREVDDFGPAATLGWRRPVILLGHDWRGWSVNECRAVLAHELAHVRHRDFLLGLVTGVCRVLYFYHPLVRWLAAQMRWHQELAADDAAATVVGGRQTYIKALARLALRLPARMPVGASMVVPSMTGGVLLRRIQMLCRMEQRPMSPTTRGLLIAFLGGMAVLVSTWRGSAQTTAPQASSVSIEPFEIGYLPPEVKGMIAVRPSVWMAQPGMDKTNKQIDELLKQAKKLGFTVPDIVRPENIEQIVTCLHVGTTGTGKPGSRSLHIGAPTVFIRFHKEVDAPDLLRPFLPDMKEVRKGNVTMYQLGTVPPVGPQPITMFQPDRRTVVLVSDKNEATAEKLLHRVTEAQRREWGTGWKDVKHAPFAAVLDNSDGNHSKTHDKDLDKSPELKEIVDTIRFATFGIEFGDGRPMRMVLDAYSADGVKRLETALIKSALGGLAKAKEDAEKYDGAAQLWLRLATDMVTGRQVNVTGSRLEWLVYSPMRLRDFIGADGLPVGSSEDGR